jgi:NDP-sugar pyrophosphorylase family protein
MNRDDRKAASRCLSTRGVVLLAAGRGSRLSTLTDDVPKPLLPLAGIPGLQRILEAVLEAKPKEVVVVVGYKSPQLIEFLSAQFGSNVKVEVNERFAEDINILSCDIGVDALSAPEEGYIIIETDVIALPSTWRDIFSAISDSRSQWVTSGRYNPSLTGGAVNVTANGAVEEIVYAPDYDMKFEGWHKILGILSVSPKEVSQDRQLRKSYLLASLRQYYMAPWIVERSKLPCDVLDLGVSFARSFNDVAAYLEADQQYTALLGGN